MVTVGFHRHDVQIAEKPRGAVVLQAHGSKSGARSNTRMTWKQTVGRMSFPISKSNQTGYEQGSTGQPCKPFITLRGVFLDSPKNPIRGTLQDARTYNASIRFPLLVNLSPLAPAHNLKTRPEHLLVFAKGEVEAYRNTWGQSRILLRIPSRTIQRPMGPMGTITC